LISNGVSLFFPAKKDYPYPLWNNCPIYASDKKPVFVGDALIIIINFFFTEKTPESGMIPDVQ